jgi:hypothetical protein
MTDHLVAAPVHPLMLAPVLMEPLNGRDLREIPEWMNERLQNGRVRQAQKISKQVN